MSLQVVIRYTSKVLVCACATRDCPPGLLKKKVWPRLLCARVPSHPPARALLGSRTLHAADHRRLPRLAAADEVHWPCEARRFPPSSVPFAQIEALADILQAPLDKVLPLTHARRIRAHACPHTVVCAHAPASACVFIHNAQICTRMDWQSTRTRHAHAPRTNPRSKPQRPPQGRARTQTHVASTCRALARGESVGLRACAAQVL
jgi:hypothetical protein